MQSGRMENLDALRGVAAFVVLLQHTLAHVWKSGPGEAIWLKSLALDNFDWGRFGVVLFFLISGFVIPNSFRGDRPLTNFAIGRAFRLYPAFWLSVAASVLVSIALFDDVPPLPQIWANLTMAYPIFRQPALSTVFWTLVIELGFYVASVAIFLCRGLDKPIIIFGAGVLCVASALFPSALRLTLYPTMPAPLFGYHLSFLFFGSLLRFTSLQAPRALALTWSLELFVLAGLPIVSGSFGDTGSSFSNALPIGAMASVVAGVIIFIVSFRISFFPSAALRLGAWSYSLYLLHEPIADVTERVFAAARLPVATLYVVSVVVIATLVAALVYSLVERPFQRLGKRLTTALSAFDARRASIMPRMAGSDRPSAEEAA